MSFIIQALGLGLKSRAKKAIFVLVMVAFVIGLVQLADQILDKILQEAFDDPTMNAPLGIQDWALYFTQVYEPLSDIMADAASWSIYFQMYAIGLILRAAGTFGGKQGISKRVYDVGDMLTTEAKEIKPKD